MTEIIGGSQPRQRAIEYLPLILAFLCVSILTYQMRDFLMDDAYIGFRYVDNLVAGHGFTFNPPEKIEGVTNIGWLLILVPLSFVLPAHVAGKIMGVILIFIAVTLTFLIARELSREEHGRYFFAPIPLLVATQFEFMYYSITGMETPLLAVLLLAIVYFSMCDTHPWLMAALGAWMFFVHPEAILVYPLVLLFSAARSDWRKSVGPALLFIAIIGALTYARYAYFGDALPNTFAAKSTSLKLVLNTLMDTLAASNTNIPAIFSGLTGILLLTWGALTIARRNIQAAHALVAVVTVGLIFCTYAKADWTMTARYFAPYAPCAMLLLWAGVSEAAKNVLALAGGQVTRRVATFVLFVIVAIAGMRPLAVHMSPSFVEHYPGYVMTAKNLVVPSLWIRENTPSDAVVATRRIGAVSYYSGRHIFDYKFGLTDRGIATLLKANGGEYFNDPGDPTIAQVWHERAPDYILEDLTVIPALKYAVATPDARTITVHGMKYLQVKTFPIGEDAKWGLWRIAD